MTTFTDLLDEYLEHLQVLNYSPHTLMGIRNNLKRFLLYLESSFDVTTADMLRKDHLFKWQKHLSEYRTVEGLPLKAETIKKQLVHAKCFLRYLAKRGFVLSAIAENIVYIRVPKMLPMGVLTHSQMKKILSKIDTSTLAGLRNRAILELMYSSALRAGEVLSLNIRDVDLENATVTVMGKWSKERVVPIGKTAMRYLESYIRGLRPFLLKGEEKEALFLNIHRGTRMTYRRLLDTVHACCDKFKTDVNVTPHTFRRTCTTELVRGGADLYHIKDMLGHESLETLKHYTNLTITDLKKTHEKCHPRG